MVKNASTSKPKGKVSKAGVAPKATPKSSTPNPDDAGTPMQGAKLEREKATEKMEEQGGGAGLTVAEALAAQGRRGPSDAQLRKDAARRDRLNPDGTPKAAPKTTAADGADGADDNTDDE